MVLVVCIISLQDLLPFRTHLEILGNGVHRKSRWQDVYFTYILYGPFTGTKTTKFNRGRAI